MRSKKRTTMYSMSCLQVLDDGRITDGQGRTVDFKNTVIILTSNIGSQYIMEDLPKEERNRRVTEALRSHFRPEFLNRVDEIIIFDRLDDRQITKIVDIQLERLVERLASKDISIQLTDAAKRFLAKEGYDPAYGARPLGRVIQKEILDPLSLEILAAAFHEGDRITVDVSEDHLAFSKTSRVSCVAQLTPRQALPGDSFSNHIGRAQRIAGE
jgi:ATP-dependent Clp protease ATP-binding subunit ClpB